jgi:dihydrofolate reductase
MGKLRCSISMSLDGFIAGPDQSEDDPLGKGGEQLHEWALSLSAWRETHGKEGGDANASSAVVEEMTEDVGATIMGRNMFGGGPGAWSDDPPWNGWWGDEPPFGHPVFVLTHHRREPLILGETTFNFVTDGIESALEQAREAADGNDVNLGGGANAVQQYLAAGLLDELQISLVPVLLGGGERLLDNLGGSGVALEPLRVVEAPGVTHLKYRVVT